jgi:glycosyltransferase involved in cell wall biosynthesis
LLVPERDVGALARAFADITADPGMLAAFGAAAAQAVRDEFEQAKAIQNLEAFYDEARAIGAVRPGKK